MKFWNRNSKSWKAYQIDLVKHSKILWYEKIYYATDLNALTIYKNSTATDLSHGKHF